MPFTKEQFIREANEKMAQEPDIIEVMVKAPAVIDRVLKDLPLERRLEGIPIARRLEGQSVDDITRLLIALEIGIPFEVVKGKSVEALFRSSPHVRERLIRAIEDRLQAIAEASGAAP